MRARFLVVAFAGALAVLARASAAHADPHSDAVKAFEEGRKLRDSTDREKLKEAARAFERSIAAEPSVGAYYNLGLVNEQLGRLRDAVDNFRKSSNLAHERGDPREKDAVDALRKLLDTRNYVVLTVPEDVAGAPGLRITLDGEEVPRAQFNGEVFRAAANHTIVVIADGWNESQFQARNRQRVEVGHGALIRPPQPPPTPPTPPTPPRPDTNEGGWGWQQWTGVGLMGAGAVAAVIGVVFVARYSSEQDALKARFANDCNKVNGVGPCAVGGPKETLGNDYQNEADDLDSRAAVKHAVTFGLAGAAIAGGLLLLLTAPSSNEKATTGGQSTPPARARIHVAPRFGQGVQGFSVIGTF